MKKRRSLDYDGLDGILQTSGLTQPKVVWYKSVWLYAIPGILLISGLVFQKPSQTPSVTANKTTELTNPTNRIASNAIEPVKPTLQAITPSSETSIEAITLSQPDAKAAEQNGGKDKPSVGSESPTDSSSQPGKNFPLVEQDSLESKSTENIDTPIQPITEPVAVSVNNSAQINSSSDALYTVHFKLDSSKLKSLSTTEVSDLLNAAQRCEKQIKLTGHTCNLGTDSSNKILGLTRAKAVKKLLVNNGVEPQRIVTTSEGMNKPSASNDTQTGQALNRRTELSCLNQ